MRIDRHSRICEIPIKAVRDFLIRYRTPYKFSFPIVLQYFGISEDQGKSLCESLISQGFIEGNREEYVVTVKGNALAQTKFVSRLNKEKADVIFEKLLKRVDEINADNKFLYRVKQLYLFGSYLDQTAADFGDIDIAIVLERKIKNAQEFMDAQSALVRQAIEEGKRFSSVVEEVGYAEKLVLSYLKNRSPYISLHRMPEILELGAKYRQIYP